MATPKSHPPKARNVIEFADDAGDITYAIVVGVHHAARIYLIYHRTAPPGSCCHLIESLVIDLVNTGATIETITGTTTRTAAFVLRSNLHSNNVREQYFFTK